MYLPPGPPQPYTLVLARTSRLGNKPETLTPTDRPHPLFTIHHKPHSLSSEPSLKLTQPNGTPIGTANFHTFSSRVDLSPTGRAPISYKAGHLPPAATPNGETWRWEVSGKPAPGQKGGRVARLLATPQGVKTSRWRRGGPQGEVVAAVYLEGGLSKGRIEVLRPGMPQSLFELVVLSAVVQVEELRKKARERARAGPVMAGGAVGGSAAAGGGDCGGGGSGN